MKRYRVGGRFASEGKWKGALERARDQVARWGRTYARAVWYRDHSRKAATRAKWTREARAARRRYDVALGKRARLERQGQRVPKGREVEITHTTKGGTPRGKRRGARVTRDTRKLQLKIRVQPAPGMTLAEVEGVLEDLASEERTRVPRGMTIRFADWRKGAGGTANKGRAVPPDVLKALREFYPAIVHETTKHGRRVLSPRRKK